mmetsp:Transcript_29037/g.88999  ORF Transcript_29037/g.88999 Transcript_29037/m.88999 type:complete len:140 (+) Transcript_29037:196-615(+)
MSASDSSTPASVPSPRSPYGPCPAVCKWRESPEFSPPHQPEPPASPMRDLGQNLLRRFSAPILSLPPTVQQSGVQRAPSTPALPLTEQEPPLESVRQLRDGAVVVRRLRPELIITAEPLGKTHGESRTPSSILHSLFGI